MSADTWRDQLVERLRLAGFAWTTEERNVVADVVAAFIDDKGLYLRCSNTVDERATALDHERGEVLRWLANALRNEVTE